ncbi:phosphoribosyltransferase domain-containing protein [Halomonas sp. 11-S5]|uniref:phosphoribosyltransferase domain-containing protein n=1 Tax=Halomonas sp. 11-S5 TaxID=2994064 RepID=UPI00246970F2|nr:phosphoribosyltransferase domain-containing protein [Halomonas sp. 11-S5]
MTVPSAQHSLHLSDIGDAEGEKAESWQPDVTRHTLSTGTLTLEIEGRNTRPLSDFFRIAERQNPKRAFLFVSTILGRHIPVTTFTHRAALDQLADIVLPHLGSGPILVMSYAETAVGLGLGVFEGLRQKCPGRSMGYLPTTRLCPEGVIPWMKTREDHSHAADHVILPPRAGVLPVGNDATLVLVDDETTTGNTFKGLALELFRAGVTVARVVLVTLTDWSDKHCITAVRDALPDASVNAVSLLSGSYTWSPSPGIQPHPLPPRCPPGCPFWVPESAESFGVPRFGLSSHDMARDNKAWAEHVDLRLLPLLKPAARVLVVGTGEHVWHPFLAAERISQNGHEASLISTTRSPVLLGPVIKNQISFPDHYGLGINMYLNNVDPSEWDEVILFTETGLSGVPAELRSALGRGWIVDGLQQITLMSKDVAP